MIGASSWLTCGTCTPSTTCLGRRRRPCRFAWQSPDLCGWGCDRPRRLRRGPALVWRWARFPVSVSCRFVALDQYAAQLCYQATVLVVHLRFFHDEFQRSAIFLEDIGYARFERQLVACVRRRVIAELLLAVKGAAQVQAQLQETIDQAWPFAFQREQ